jgi:hypothetical protein
MNLRNAIVVCAAGTCLVIAPALAQGQNTPQANPPAPPAWFAASADYDAELRLPNGRVDVDGLLARLKELRVAGYYWLIWHANTDWDDLKLFLPKAAEAKLTVWVYLVPPSESPPHAKQYAEPFRCDYHRWAEEIARLSLEHPNLTAWVIDDFYANRALYTPDYVRQMQAGAKKINPRLAFLPLMYFPEITRRFVQDYGQVIEGVVVAYPRDREEIDGGWAILNDAAALVPGQFACPWQTGSQAGDFAAATMTASVLPAEHYRVSFREQDDYSGQTAGYHFKQLLVDDAVVWEEDVSGGNVQGHDLTVDVTPQARGKENVALTFRLLEKKGVGNFGVRWSPSELKTEGLQVAAGLRQPGKWRVSGRGPLEAGFGEALQEGKRSFHIPYFVMTAADVGEFRLRHGNPASPERISQWLRMCLQARRDGKCEGVVTYCLDKSSQSPTFPSVAGVFREFPK